MRSRDILRTGFLTGFLFSFHVALTVYVNSSYLATKIPETLVGTLYTASAVVAMIGLYLVPRLIARTGSRAVMGTLVAANIANIVAMIASNSTAVIAVCFVLFFAFNTLIYLGLDILIENWSDNETQGAVRGSYLTANNVGYMIAPFIAGFVADRLGFGALYGMAIVLVIPVLFLLTLRLPAVRQSHPSKANVLALARKFWGHPSLRAVFVINFILQFFYAWMVIYTPIFLHEHAGIAWDTIGIMFSIMLSAFVIFQYAAGKLADRFHCEKWMLVAGLVIMGVATMFVAKAPSVTFWTLAAVLFVTRVGASLVEVMTESYFFKNVHHDDTGSIGFFRNTYPFAYILAPILASATLNIAPMWTLFVILGIICIAGTLFTIDIKPNK